MISLVAAHVNSPIHDRDGAAGMKPPTPQDVLRTSSGHLMVMTTNPSVPLLFDESGAFVAQLGRRGEGPGEFRSPRSAVQGVGDTIWVLDSGLRRRTAWSPEGEYLGATRRTPGFVHAVELSDGIWVFNGLLPAAISFPFHRVGAGGNVDLSFGPEVRAEPGAHPGTGLRRDLAPGADGNFWAISPYEYKLEKYDLQGDLLTVIERNVDWFVERDPSVSWSLAEDGPATNPAGLVESDNGLLKTLVNLPGENWREGIGERELQPGFEEAGIYWTPIRDYRKAFNFVIEVIDPERGELLHRERFAGLTLGWVDEHHIATYHQDEFDIPIIEIHRVDFTDTR